MAIGEEIQRLGVHLMVALAVGLLIGLERGWQDRGDPAGSRVAGFRTFGLIGLAGGLAAALDAGNGFVIAAAAVGLALLLRTGFEESVEETGNVSATTMVAALVTFGLGALAVRVSPLLAGAGGVITAFILWLRAPMHRLLDMIEPHELSAFLRLLLISIVILPIMPDADMGPYGVINPRNIWWMVVLISGLSFAGYAGVKFLGERSGVSLLALAGGLASSTAATISFARLSKEGMGQAAALAGGTAAAWTVMVVRTMVIAGVLRPSLLGELWLPMGAMLVVTGAMAAAMLWQHEKGGPVKLSMSNPLDLRAALVLAAVLTAALVISRFAEDLWGQGGILGVSAIAGAVDADAVTISMARLTAGETPDSVAAQAIVTGAVANTLFKAGLAMVSGERAYGRRVMLTALAVVPAGVLGVLAAGML